MELQRLPQPQAGIFLIARAHQQVQGCTVLIQQVGGEVCADVSRATGQEYRHVAPLVPVFIAMALFSAEASWKVRAGRASSGRPSIKG